MTANNTNIYISTYFVGTANDRAISNTPLPLGYHEVHSLPAKQATTERRDAERPYHFPQYLTSTLNNR